MPASKWRWILPIFALVIGVTLGAYGNDMLVSLGRASAKSNAIDGVMVVLNQQQDAWNKGDLPGFLSHYEMTDAITFYSDDVVAQGWVAVSDRYTNSYVINKKPMGQLEFTDVVYVPLSGDAVMVRGRWTTKAPTKTSTGLFTILVKKTDTGWKIVHDHTSERKEPK